MYVKFPEGTLISNVTIEYLTINVKLFAKKSIIYIDKEEKIFTGIYLNLYFIHIYYITVDNNIKRIPNDYSDCFYR